MLHLYFLELHRQRIAEYDRDVARRYSRPAAPTVARAPRDKAGLLRRRQPRLVARDAC